MSPDDAWKILNEAEIVADSESVRSAIGRIATELTVRFRETHPLLLVVMNGGVFFAGQLLPLLRFPLELDYVHATRYGPETTGGNLVWKARPQHKMKNRCVLVIDDVLDEGKTLAAIRDHVIAEKASSCHLVVLTEKETGIDKPARADYVGLTLPNRFVFGCGLDISGAWRNLPEIYAKKGS